MFGAGVLVAGTVLVTTPAGAGILSFGVDPDEGLPGASVAVSGVCPDDVNEFEAVFFYLDQPGGGFFDLGDFPITPGDPWTFTVTVPDDAQAGATQIGKQCARVDDDGNFDGGEATERLDFEVLAAPATTTTTTEPATTVAAAPDEAEGATAVAATPTFTG
jgi:hypothetical protein